MIKSELIQRIAEHNPHLYQRDVEKIVNAILDEIVAALARGDRVELRGFGAFSVKRRSANEEARGVKIATPKKGPTSVSRSDIKKAVQEHASRPRQ